MTETVADVLARKPREIWSVGPDCTVYDAIASMAEKNIGALLVLAGGELIGMVSERDYARKVILSGRSSRDTEVQEIMTSPLTTVTPDTPVEECMRIVIGDLVKAIISGQAETIHQLHNYISGQYP